MNVGLLQQRPPLRFRAGLVASSQKISSAVFIGLRLGGGVWLLF